MVSTLPISLNCTALFLFPSGAYSYLDFWWMCFIFLSLFSIASSMEIGTQSVIPTLVFPMFREHLTPNRRLNNHWVNNWNEEWRTHSKKSAWAIMKQSDHLFVHEALPDQWACSHFPMYKVPKTVLLCATYEVLSWLLSYFLLSKSLHYVLGCLGFNYENHISAFALGSQLICLSITSAT